jgi:hypothetical protein
MFGGTTRFWFQLEDDAVQVRGVPWGVRQVLGLCSSDANVVLEIYKRLRNVIIASFRDPCGFFRDLVWEKGQVRLRDFLSSLAKTKEESEAIRKRRSILTNDLSASLLFRKNHTQR